jgi:hypothetical protein
VWSPKGTTLRVIRCPTLQVSQFLFPGQRSDTFLTDHVCMLLPSMVCSAWLLAVGVRCRAAGCACRKRDAAQSCTTSWFFFSAHMQRCTDKHTSNCEGSCVISYHIHFPLPLQHPEYQAEWSFSLSNTFDAPIR